MRRGFWIALGLGAGATVAVLASRWTKRQRERLAPANIGRKAGQTVKDAGSLMGEVAREFRAGMADRGAEIRSSLPE